MQRVETQERKLQSRVNEVAFLQELVAQVTKAEGAFRG